MLKDVNGAANPRTYTYLCHPLPASPLPATKNIGRKNRMMVMIVASRTAAMGVGANSEGA